MPLSKSKFDIPIKASAYCLSQVITKSNANIDNHDLTYSRKSPQIHIIIQKPSICYRKTNNHLIKPKPPQYYQFYQALKKSTIYRPS